MVLCYDSPDERLCPSLSPPPLPCLSFHHRIHSPAVLESLWGSTDSQIQKKPQLISKPSFGRFEKSFTVPFPLVKPCWEPNPQLLRWIFYKKVILPYFRHLNELVDLSALQRLNGAPSESFKAPKCFLVYAEHTGR